jgi:IS5 family transposase
MRTMMQDQMPLMQPFISHEHGRELETMSATLDKVPEVLKLLDQDLTRGCKRDVGRPGMSAEQVLRALVVKQMNGYSYEELSFHLADSISYRTFCRIGVCEETPSRSALQANISRVSAGTLESVNRALLGMANEEGIEDGSVVRGDCTTVESNIHPPTDSSMLWDVERVLLRLMEQGAEYGMTYTNHKKRAKRRWHDIRNAKKREERVRLYGDLVKVVEETLGEAEEAILVLGRWEEEEAKQLVKQLKKYVGLGGRVIDQTRRRVFERESVPSLEKVVSIFEDHTDILVKGSRETEYGHKVCLTGGASSMILDCQVLKGNPADSTLIGEMLKRHCEVYGEVPEEVAFDGGFASRSNLEELKGMGIQEVAFSKRCGLPLSEMVTESWVYKRLRDFRAGIEGCISFLKRSFGLDRCLWRGLKSFQAYVWSSIISVNLLLMARHRMSG